MQGDPENATALLMRAWEKIGEVQRGLADTAAWPPEHCVRVLSEALALVEPVPGALAPAGSPGHATARQTAIQVRRELARVRTLLDSSAAFFGGWGRLRAGLAAGYTAQGTPADLPPAHRLSLAG